jgi:selenide,water dikinase
VAKSLFDGCPTGGCGAKLDPALLAQFLARLPRRFSDQLLVSYDHSDDAAVFSLSPDLAVVSTVDFFPPMVDDGRLFGQIAATNALSDIYAMGGQPILALNLVCFPQNLDPEILAEILLGGAETIAKAGAFLAGGHSIYDPLPKYGLAVTGLVNPKETRYNHTVKVGDALILTKPLGVGLILAAHRAGESQKTDLAAAITSMTRLNAAAAMALKQKPISAVTDVTGFGLLGHLAEMVGTDYSADLNFDSLPLLPGALNYAAEFFISGLAQRNRLNLASKVDLTALTPIQEEILFDPQTSGGLLISLPAAAANGLLLLLKPTEPEAAIIGTITAREPGGAAITVL